MNKKFLVHFQKIEQLSVKNLDYQRILDELFLFFVRNDHIEEDITVQSFLPDDISFSMKQGVISSKSLCIVAGVEEVVYLCRKHTKLTPEVLCSDGSTIELGTKILSLQGSAKDILAYERVFLNMLQRMSGIATETQRYIAKINKLELVHPPLIAATRKTPWMHLDKKAVAVGGGATHRLDLKDGILLKDNHLELLQQELSLGTGAEAIVFAIEHAVVKNPKIAIEVEVKTEDGAFAAVEGYKKRVIPNPFIILLDNFTPELAKTVVGKTKKENENIFFEASGGIHIDNVVKFAKTGVDILSIGALTHSPKAADLSMDIL